MKYKKIGKFGLIVLLTLLMSFQVVKSLGITGPRPPDLRMLRGDSTEFSFQIQAISSTNKQSCTVYTEGFDSLIITFENNPITVNAGESKSVYGTITVPGTAPIKTYSGKVWASCTPVVETQDVSGSKISQTMGVKFSLAVVATEAERNIPSMRKKIEEVTPTISTSAMMTIIIIIIAVVAIGVYYWSKRGREAK